LSSAQLLACPQGANFLARPAQGCQQQSAIFLAYRLKRWQRAKVPAMGSFSLVADFRKDFDDEEVENTFLLLTLIYDSTFLLTKVRRSLNEIETTLLSWL
jgi:hypothetical protein